MSTTTAAGIALALFACYLLLGFGLRTWLQHHRTGDSGFRGVSGRPGSVEWAAGVGFVVALVTGLLGPVAALLGLGPVALLYDGPFQAAGLVLAIVGVAGTVLTQIAMGNSWRIGVDHAETTALVTDGPFAIVRNPIFTAMAMTALGLALLVPNVVSLLGLLLLVVSLQLQVRIVEEPYLLATHGEVYSAYASQTGRFLPGLGLRACASRTTGAAVERGVV